MPAFINMVSDEIEQLHDAGRTDKEIAAPVEVSSGRALTEADIARYYTLAEDRQSRNVTMASSALKEAPFQKICSRLSFPNITGRTWEKEDRAVSSHARFQYHASTA